MTKRRRFSRTTSDPLEDRIDEWRHRGAVREHDQESNE